MRGNAVVSGKGVDWEEAASPEEGIARKDNVGGVDIEDEVMVKCKNNG